MTIAAQPTFPTPGVVATENVEDPVSNSSQTTALNDISVAATVVFPDPGSVAAEHDEAQLTAGGPGLAAEVTTANAHISSNAAFNTARPGTAAEHLE